MIAEGKMENQIVRKFKWFWAWQDDKEEAWLSEMGGWQYFRKTRQGNESPEIYTDPESKVQKYRRLLGLLVIFFPIYFVLITNSPSDATHLIYQIGKLLGGALVILFVIAMIKIYLRMNQLRRL